jgi:ABC-type bacteriocin/lantibiotic exporter with double-glycine peptidase domain
MGWQAAVTASNGQSYEWYQQDKENSCGCASILMMTFFMQGKKLDESTVRQWMNQIECGQNSSKEGVRSFDDRGGNIFNYTGVLAEKCKIKSHTVRGDAPVRRWVTTATAKKPLLAHVFWDGGGGHTVLVAGHHGTNTIFLDPGCGLVEIADADLLTYVGPYSTGDVQGTILALAQPS